MFIGVNFFFFYRILESPRETNTGQSGEIAVVAPGTSTALSARN